MAQEMEETAEYAVFDDVKINFFPAWKSWLGGMAYISNKVLYRDTRLMKWGRPCIWCNNTDPRDVMRRSMAKFDGQGDGDFDQNDLDWIEKNCIFIYVGEPIVTFHASTE